MSVHINGIHTRYAARSVRGFSLIEMAVTLAVLGILLAIAAPQFNLFFEKFRTKRAAETLVGTLIQAKTEAVKRNQVVRLVITGSGSGATWCYGLTTAADCDCTVAVPGTNSCFLDANVETAVSSVAYRAISMVDTSGDEIASMTFSFDNIRGTTGPNTVAFVSQRGGYEMRTVVSPQGRIKPCSPAGSHYIGGGYTQC